MPRTIQLHPLSLLVGVGFALLGLVAMGQMPAANRPAAQHDSMYLQVAHPRDWVIIQEGVPFSVPASRFLVISGIGASDYSSNCSPTLTFDGQSVIQVNVHDGTQVTKDTATIKVVPVGLSAAPGTLVELSGSVSDIGRA